MALPVSWAITRRCSAVFDSGSVLSSHTGVPKGTLFGSTAIERPGVSGTPWAPRGPTLGSGSGSSRKKTTRGLLHSISCTRLGLRRAQSLMAGQLAPSALSSPWLMSQRPTDA